MDAEPPGTPGQGLRQHGVGRSVARSASDDHHRRRPDVGRSAANYTYTAPNPANFADVTGTTNNSNLPGSLSLDQYPDIVGKVAFDPGFGHYEVYGLGRFFTDRTLVNGSRDNNTTFGWGAGGAVLLPVVPKFLDFQGSFLAGQGIGRYGSAGFSDAVVNPITGKLDPLSEVEALVGLVAHPNDRLDIYGYAGMEQAARKDVYGTTGGFGNAAYAPASPCSRKAPRQAPRSFRPPASNRPPLGFWYSFYKGSYGMMRVGLSDSYSRLQYLQLAEREHERRHGEFPLLSFLTYSARGRPPLSSLKRGRAPTRFKPRYTWQKPRNALPFLRRLRVRKA